MRNILFYTGPNFAIEALCDPTLAAEMPEEFDRQQVGTAEGFASNPDKAHRYYNHWRKVWSNAEPTEAHKALVRLTDAKRVAVVTSGMDDILERAGLGNVFHIAGEIMKARCGACRHIWRSPMELTSDTTCPECGEAKVEPDVTWLGDEWAMQDMLAEAAAEADLVVIAGTHEGDFMAGMLCAGAQDAGVEMCALALSPTVVEGEEEAQIEVPRWVDKVLET